MMSLFEDLGKVLSEHNKVMKQTACCTFEIHDKPAPELIVKRSGGTWVARYDGVDYLNIKPFNEYATEENVSSNFLVERNDKRFWTPFSEIEITDEIAKLRPMVKIMDSIDFAHDLCILTYKGVNWYQCSDELGEIRYRAKNVSLATIDDLQ